MTIRSVRFSKETKNQLIRLKRKTGIPTFNVLCRWAFCHSLTDTENNVSHNRPVPTETVDTILEKTASDSTQPDKELEIDWRVLSGSYSEVMIAILKQNCLENGLTTDVETMNEHLKHLIENGIKHLVADESLKTIDDLFAIAINSNSAK